MNEAITLRSPRAHSEFHVVCPCGAVIIARDTVTLIECLRCGLVVPIAWPNDPLVNVQATGGPVAVVE